MSYGEAQCALSLSKSATNWHSLMGWVRDDPRSR